MFGEKPQGGRCRSLKGSAAPCERLHVTAAVPAHTVLPEDALGAVGAFPLITGLGGEPCAATGAGLDIVGVGLLANRAGLRGRVCGPPAGRVLAAAMPPIFT
jgi:hypothetical protein